MVATARPTRKEPKVRNQRARGIRDGRRARSRFPPCKARVAAAGLPDRTLACISAVQLSPAEARALPRWVCDRRRQATAATVAIYDRSMDGPTGGALRAGAHPG